MRRLAWGRNSIVAADLVVVCRLEDFLESGSRSADQLWLNTLFVGLGKRLVPARAWRGTVQECEAKVLVFKAANRLDVSLHVTSTFRERHQNIFQVLSVVVQTSKGKWRFVGPDEAEARRVNTTADVVGLVDSLRRITKRPMP